MESTWCRDTWGGVYSTVVARWEYAIGRKSPSTRITRPYACVSGSVVTSPSLSTPAGGATLARSCRPSASPQSEGAYHHCRDDQRVAQLPA